MSTQIDWQGELDRAIEHVPDRPAADYVLSGRRAVRRRRTAVAAGGLAAALVIGGVAWSALPGGGPDGEPELERALGESVGVG